MKQVTVPLRDILEKTDVLTALMFVQNLSGSYGRDVAQLKHDILCRFSCGLILPESFYMALGILRGEARGECLAPCVWDDALNDLKGGFVLQCEANPTNLMIGATITALTGDKSSLQLAYRDLISDASHIGTCAARKDILTEIFERWLDRIEKEPEPKTMNLGGYLYTDEDIQSILENGFTTDNTDEGDHARLGPLNDLLAHHNSNGPYPPNATEFYVKALLESDGFTGGEEADKKVPIQTPYCRIHSLHHGTNTAYNKFTQTWYCIPCHAEGRLKIDKSTWKIISVEEAK